MANLYELAEEFAALRAVDRDELTDDELTALLDAVDESRIDLRTKVDNICRLIANIGSEAEAVKREEHRLGARRKALENKEERLRDWVRTTMDLMEVHQIKTDTHSVSLQKGTLQVIITALQLVPEEFLKRKVEPNKTALLAAFKETGEIVAGTDIVEGKPKLVIR